MAVGSQQYRAGPAETLHVDYVAYAVARLAIPDAPPPTRTLEEQMVIRVPGVRLQEIVINVLCRKLRSHAVQPHCL